MPGTGEPLSREQIDAKLKLQFYVSDDVIEAQMTEWREWCLINAPETMFSFSSASYSGFRWVTFLFDRAEEASLFRLMFGGNHIVTEP